MQKVIGNNLNECSAMPWNPINPLISLCECCAEEDNNYDLAKVGTGPSPDM